MDLSCCTPEDSPEDAFHRACFGASKREAEIMNCFHGEKHIMQYLDEPEYLEHTFINA